MPPPKDNPDLSTRFGGERANPQGEPTTEQMSQGGVNSLTVQVERRAMWNAVEKSAEVTAERVLAELATIAFYDPSRVFSTDENGLPQIDFSNATEEDWRVLAEVTNKTTRDKLGNTTVEGKVKHQCKLQALNALARHLGMNNDKTEHSGGIEIKVEYVDTPTPPPPSGTGEGAGIEGEA